MKTISSIPLDKPQPPAGLDWELIRAKLAGEKKADYWKSLEELAETLEFKSFVEREFPSQANEWPDPVSRRRFLSLMTASIALAGWSGCTQRQPNEKIVPYVAQPEQMLLGRPLFFATAMTLGGYATGLLVRSREGRPVKVEGNPEHPFSLGGTNVFHQASLLDLYDPGRSKAILHVGENSSWAAFTSQMRTAMQQQRSKGGAGLRILTETITSPALTAQIQSLLKQYPQAHWHSYEPVTRENLYEGARSAFGEVVEAQHHIDKAKVIVSLDSDFLGTHPGSLRYARQFALGRKVHSTGNPTMNRLYVVESQVTITGSVADHRLPVAPSEIPQFAAALAEAIGTQNQARNSAGPYSQWIQAVAGDLQKNRGASLVLAGEQQPPAVHVLAHRINQALANIGQTITFTDPVAASPWEQLKSVRELTEAMGKESVEVLVILGTNPVFTAPADLNFGEALGKVKTVVHLGLNEDETSRYAHWHIPEAHYLESWGDARALDGTASIQQPLIDPLYGGRTALEVLEGIIAPESGRTAYDIVRDHWIAQKRWPDFEKGWRKALHDGLIENSAFPPRQVQIRPDAQAPSPAPSANQGLEISFAPDPTIWDGRFANNAWLQELPKPITKLTWDNALHISPSLAEKLTVSNGDMLEVGRKGRTLRVPCWIVPGHPEQSVTMHFGYGRENIGTVGRNTGFNAYALRTSDAPWSSPGLELKRINGHYKLAGTQQHQSLHGRDVFREATFEVYKNNPTFAHGEGEKPKPSLYNLTAQSKSDAAWGMVIDLNACIGCGACNMACYAENNIPVVGKDQVLRGREMQWIRVDTYFRGTPKNPEMAHQPVPCMHCETAPCELVCPVEATLHNAEGLNLQVYNRCIGTRYCSNNCPYKVRRFNFLQYSDRKTPSLQLMHNPEVTVRTRGVMEKCTYCVQRIQAARIEADKENRPIRDGEVTTACAQACPADAIVFGNLRDPNSRVMKLKQTPLNYSMLGELNTFPRTTYLAKVRNPNPALA
ncbi:MAG: molybdopterin oxidoreductase, iron-sulfur binding subunit [Verrucomicrobiales bacterium]|nr:molybdopterin oxidoreductase, iron-sulfur binding subunit [Verrucomicrobiales bacterium]